MTAIAGVIDNGKVWIGSDSCGANMSFCAWNLSEPKTFRSESFLIGIAGSPRVSQIVQFKLSLKDDPRKETREFMCIDFADRVRQVMSDNGCKIVKDNVDGISGNSWMLIGFRGRLFVCCDDFQIIERRQKFDAIGCGADLCLGSLHATEKMKAKPKDRIIRALQCAEEFSAGVRSPFNVECL